MLTFRDPFSNALMPILAAPGDMIGVGFILPSGTEASTCARVLVVGDLVRRILEDVHSVQVLAATITDDGAAAEHWASDLMTRPVSGVFTTPAAVEADLGRPLDLVITVAECSDKPTPSGMPALGVARVHGAVERHHVDSAAVRLALASTPYEQPLVITNELLGHTHGLLARWRQALEPWSRHPSHPIPPHWRATLVAALDDDLDVARVLAMMAKLENAEDVEPGAKFETFSYLDRVLAVDLARHLGRPHI